MNMSHCIVFRRGLAFFVFLAVISGLALLPGGGATPAFAAQVTVLLPHEESVSRIQFDARLKEEGFVEAVYSEALRLLPGSLDAQRAGYLKEFLRPRAGQFVLSYSQGLRRETGEGVESTFDVRVHGTALRSMLQRLGLYSTLFRPIPFSLSVSGPKPADLPRLEILSGVVPDAMAQPNLEISGKKAESGKMIWRARLASDEDFWEVAGPEIETVWYRVWGGYFSRKAPGPKRGNELSLLVSGWFFPEGAQAFDRVLSSWDSLVERSTLQAVNMDGVGVSARWSVAFTDRDRLRERLAEYTHSRKLSFVLGNSKQDDAL